MKNWAGENQYKVEQENNSLHYQIPVEEFAKNSDDFRFASAVAQFGMLLRDSKFKKMPPYQQVIDITKKAIKKDNESYRKEVIRLVRSL